MKFEYSVYEDFKSFFIHSRNEKETEKIASVLADLADDYKFKYGDCPEWDLDNLDNGGWSFRVWGDEITTRCEALALYKEIKTETADTEITEGKI
jgi:hypothetical protein